MPSTIRSFRLTELAARFELPLIGNGETLIDGVGTLRSASRTQATFLANPIYRRELEHTGAGVVLLKEEDASQCPTNALLAPEPYVAYARLAALFDPRPVAVPGKHPSAVIDPSARLGESVSIGPQAVIGSDCDIGDGSAIGPGVIIESHSSLGRECRVHANVFIGFRAQIGDRVILHPGVVIGADGFGIAMARDHWEKVPQLGRVVIGSDCEIGANTTIDRGAIEDTVLEEDVRIDNLVQIAHNVHIGAHTAIAAMTGIAGSARIGRYCMLGGASRVFGHITIADRVTIAGNSTAYKSIDEPGTTWSSLVPAQPIATWQRNLARLLRLDELARRIPGLEHAQKSSEDEQLK